MLTTTFRAYVHEKFGNPLQVVKLRRDVKHLPLAPSQVRIKVHSAAVNPADCKFIEFGEKIFPTRPTPANPFRIGHDVSGTVVDVGTSVIDVNVGDHVIGMTKVGQPGTFADYVDIEAAQIAPKPSNMTFNEAAGVPAAGLTSYQALATHGKLESGHRILILGGSTATGLLGIQIAKALGASFIAATVSSRNVAFAQTFGLDRAIDYTKEKWWEVLESHSIDLIYDCGVEPNAWEDGAQRLLKKDTGILVTLGQGTAPTPSSIGASLVAMQVSPGREDLMALNKLVQAGQLVVPIDSVHPFENLCDAMEKQQTNRARGKIILQVSTAE